MEEITTDHSDVRNDWERLLHTGDATALVALFQEAMCNTSEDVVSLLTFFETHVFATALKIDLENLKNSSSASLFHDPIAVKAGHSFDSREVLTQLLFVREFKDGRGVFAFIRFVRVAFRQVFFDAIRRVRNCTNFAEKIGKASLVMKAWYQGTIQAVLRSLLVLVQQDARPQMIQTNHKLDGVSSAKNFSTVCNNKCADSDEAHENVYTSDEEKELGANKTLEPGTLRAFLQLSLDIMHIIGDSTHITSLLLTVKGLARALSPYNDDNEYLGKYGLKMRQWAIDQYQVKNTRTFLAPSASCAKSELDGGKKEKPLIPEILREISEVDACATLELLHVASPEGVVSFFSKYVKKDFPKDDIESRTFEDSERGQWSTDVKVFTLLTDFKDELKTLEILSDDDSLSDEEDAFDEEAKSLQKIGFVFFLHDALTTVSIEHTFFFSMSPKMLFLLSGPYVLESLNFASLSVVMCGMAFLVLILSHISPYCICTPGEGVEYVEQRLGEFSKPKENYSDFRTRRFELIFELMKSLLSIATLCPSESHRVIARALVYTLLQRCDLELRLLLYSSFLVVTPYPSICSIIMQCLLKEWNNNGPDFTGDAQFIKLMSTVPKYLLRSEEKWIRRMKIGEVAFVEPLIQSFNFLRLVIVDTRRSNRDTQKFFKFDTKTGMVRLPNKESKSKTSWEALLIQIFTQIRAPLRAMLRSSDGSEKSADDIVSSTGLSPVNCFSLSMSLDGLEKEVMEVL